MEKNARFDHHSPTSPERTPPCCAHDAENEPKDTGKSASAQGGASLMDRLVSAQTTEKKA